MCAKSILPPDTGTPLDLRRKALAELHDALTEWYPAPSVGFKRELYTVPEHSPHHNED